MYTFKLDRDYGVIITIQLNNQSVSYKELVELFRDFSSACGYVKETIDKYIEEPY